MTKRAFKRTVILCAAVFFFLLGVVGLVLPILQGLLFLAIAIVLLSILSSTFQENVERHTRKYPKLHAFVVKVEHFIKNIVGEV